MKKLFFIVICFFFCTLSYSQDIIYNLPQKVEDKVQSYLDKIKSENSTASFFAKLSHLRDNVYLLSLMERDTLSSANYNPVEYYLVKRTNRKLKIKQSYLLPLVTGEDIIFADLGSEKLADGRIMHKKVVINIDGFSITFTQSGQLLMINNLPLLAIGSVR